jgi:hypothetical protein
MIVRIKKLFLLLSIVVYCSPSQAQFNVGFQAAVRVSSVSAIPDLSVPEPRLKSGVSTNIGVLGQYSINKEFAINSGLVFQTIAFTNQNPVIIDVLGNQLTSVPIKTSIRYLQVPLLVKYKFKASNTTSVILGVGPNINFYLSSKDKILESRENNTTGLATTSTYNKTIVGFNLLTGVEIGGVQILLDAQSNVGNLSESSRNFTSFNRAFSIGLTAVYFLPKSKK